jgi:plasmid maintenance system antidote protein VapI
MAATTAEQLRAIILGSGISCGELGRISGVDRRQVARFVSGERDLTLETAGKLIEALGLTLAGAGARRRSPER